MGKCADCGGFIEWRKTDGKWQGHNADGSIHWDKCSQRKWDQVVATGRPFANKSGHGYKDSMHGTKFAMKKDIKPVIGSDYKPLCNCQPPWEHCEHTVIVGMMV